MKLIDILREIGETTAKPYFLTKVDESVYYVIYEFETKNPGDKAGTKYKIIIGKNFRAEDPRDESDEDRDENELEFSVSFGVVDRGSVDFGAEFKDVKNLFRVMATVIKAIKIAIEDETYESGIPVTRIIIEPTKREIRDPETGETRTDKSDKRRANLYMQYIKSNMPAGSKVRELGTGDKIIVDLPIE